MIGNVGIIEWVEAATRTRNAEERVVEPPKPKDLEKEMRKDRKQYIQFIVRMLPPVYGKEMWNEIVIKEKFTEFVTASQEAFALLLYKNGYEAWSWIGSDSSSSSDSSGNGGVVARPVFKYIARSKEHVMARNSGWTMQGLEEFNALYNMVKVDRLAHGRDFDEALLDYYMEKKAKKRRSIVSEDMRARKSMKISDDLEGFGEEALGDGWQGGEMGEMASI